MLLVEAPRPTANDEEGEDNEDGSNQEMDDNEKSFLACKLLSGISIPLLDAEVEDIGIIFSQCPSCSDNCTVTAS
jgi:hypothetical protein